MAEPLTWSQQKTDKNENNSDQSDAHDTNCVGQTNADNGGAEQSEAIKVPPNLKKCVDSALKCSHNKDSTYHDESRDMLDSTDSHTPKEARDLLDTDIDGSVDGQDSNRDVAELNRENTETTKTKKLSRSAKKRKRHEEILQQRKEDRKRKKNERKQRDNVERPITTSDAGFKTKRDIKEETRQKCEAALKLGQKICIDCSLEDFMSLKEHGKLAMQVGRLYGSNKRVESPAHIYITGLKKDGNLYNELVKKNDGFLKYLISIEEKSHTELFPLDQIVVLSPDSDTVLEDIEPDKVYVIGGLVDESVTKNITSSRASETGIQTARLPIDEYMTKIDQPSHSKVLAVNQVFDILLSYMATKNWKATLSTGVPKRKGFVVNSENE